MIGQRDLERGVGGLRPGIAEEHVIEASGREIGDAACEFERLRNPELERRRVIERSACLAIASTICVRPWPALVHHIPDAASMILRPSTVK